MIKCLICGREFSFLPTHLRKTHRVSVADYREAFDIAEGEPLASEEYRLAHREKIRRMQVDGRMNYEHLPIASEKSRQAKIRPKRGAALERQRETIAASKPWTATQLPPGVRRSDGRDADRAREYQREYRKRVKK